MPNTAVNESWNPKEYNCNGLAIKINNAAVANEL